MDWEWQKVTLIGVGLLGGSLGLALKETGRARQIVGHVRRPERIAESVEKGAVHSATTDLHAAVHDADLVVLCTPISQMAPSLERALPSLKPGALITDVGSVKGPLVRALEPLARRAGVQAARARLFDNATVVLTPSRFSPSHAVERLRALWESVGARVTLLDADAHDEHVGRSSHLPHVIAALLARWVLDPAHGPETAHLCATGFKDTSRVASGSPEMWRDIVVSNRLHLSRALREFASELHQFQTALDAADESAVERWLIEAKMRRDEWQAGIPGNP